MVVAVPRLAMVVACMRQTNSYPMVKEVGMDSSFIPEFVCRFKIRKDIDCHIGYFELGEVVMFNDIGGFIAQRIDGENSVKEIARQLNDEFPEVESPTTEVKGIVQQLKECGFC